VTGRKHIYKLYVEFILCVLRSRNAAWRRYLVPVTGWVCEQNQLYELHFLVSDM